MNKYHKVIERKNINCKVVISKEYSTGKKQEETKAYFNYEAALEGFQSSVASVMCKILKANPKNLESNLKKSHDYFEAISTETRSKEESISCTIKIKIEKDTTA